MGRNKKDIILENIEIEAVAAEGKAIAKVDGAVLFVQFAVPGDIVDVKVTKKKKNYMEGYILRLVRPSADRIEPFCSHFGVCGGCKWQPLPYRMQLQAKQQQVYDQLVRIGHLDVPEIQPIVPSGKTEGYRNKLEFTFSNRRWIESGEDPEAIPPQDRCGLGFHVGRFFDKVLDIRHCYLQPEPSDSIRLFIRKYALEHGLEFFDIREHRGFLRNMIIRNNLKGDVMLIVCFYREDAAARTALLDAVAREARAEGARTVRLNTSVQGVEANALYTRCGFTRHHPIWLPYPELPMPGWTNLWELRLDTERGAGAGE